MQRTRGFTLIEVLVALTIMAVMAMMAWQGVDGIVRTRAGSEARLERTLRLQSVMAQWETDLAEVVDTQVVPPMLFDGSTLRLTRRTPAGVQTVTWALKGGSWQRWAGPVVTHNNQLQEAWFQSHQLMGNEPGQLRALGGVTEWQLYCFQGNAWINCQSTGGLVAPAAPAPGASAPPSPVVLPSGLRSVLSFGEGSGLTGTLTREVRLTP